ncbi:hypothetical protein FBEOM_4601 [Fusarium beomiforme]|uniref:Uncharacterized protein n=1 Tax=Fusarium beomiforme TaxID=44412 RepID=A0A9P5DZR4_9HYPO|nr:hypothetical protein FBEOM_4601 [Fusarium beomiforme]
MAWVPGNTKLPQLCAKVEDYDPDRFICDSCSEKEIFDICVSSERMGHVLFCFVKHIEAMDHLNKEEYQSMLKTIRLRKKAKRAIASLAREDHPDTMKEQRAEHMNARHLAEHAGTQQGFNSMSHGIDNSTATGVAQMPARCGPKEMPEDCIWNPPSDGEN